MPKISLSGPAQLLAAIPYHLGFRPDRSIVVVCFHDRRLGLMARLDAVGSEHAAIAAATLLPALVREAPTSVAIVGFEATAGETLPLSDALATGVGLERIPLRERLIVRDGRWFGLGCDCCPAEGTPMPKDADVPALAMFVGLGQAVLGNRHAMTRLVEPLDPSDPRHDALVNAICEWQSGYAWSLVNDVDDQLGALVGAVLDPRGWGDDEFDDLDDDLDGPPTDHLVDGFGDGFGDDPREAFAQEGPPPGVMIEVALLCWRALLCDELNDVALEAMLPQLVGPLRFSDLRDAIIAWLCPGTMTLDHVDPDLVEALRRCLGDDLRAPEQPPSHSAAGSIPSLDLPSSHWPTLSSTPDGHTALDPRAITARLERLCRATPTPHAAPLLSVFAAYAWWAGNGTKAGMAVDRALEIEGEHRLCGLIRTALDHGVRAPLPGWAA